MEHVEDRPTHSKRKLKILLILKEEYNLMAMIALGVSEDDVPNSPRKDLKKGITYKNNFSYKIW